MRFPTRRLFAASTLGLAAAALAGCTVATNGGTTTGMLDVATITRDGEALIASLSAVLAAPAVAPLLGANAAVAQIALGSANDALTQINALTGGTLAVSVDTAKVQTLVVSLLSDAQTVLGVVQGVASNLTGAASASVQNYVAAGLTLIPFLQLAAQVGSASKVGAARPVTLMSERQALDVARLAR